MKIGSDISVAADLIKSGRLVAFPTETVYGLGANACDDHAVAAIYAAKGRPSFNPLIVHVASAQQARQLVEWNMFAELLTKAYWPGPLTLVLPRKENCPISLLASAGLDSLAVRVPAHPLAQELLRLSGLPIAAPSANRSGCVSATNVQHVAEDFADIDVYVVDGNQAEIGLESTVLDCRGGKVTLLRSGALLRRDIERKLGFALKQHVAEDEALHSPGQLSSHYAPSKALRLNVQNVYHYESLLAFGSDVPAGARAVLNLSESGDLQEAAANLFAMLRALDATDCEAIAAMPVPHVGLGEAINDRLMRAAAD